MMVYGGGLVAGVYAGAGSYVSRWYSERMTRELWRRESDGCNEIDSEQLWEDLSAMDFSEQNTSCC